MAQCAKYLRRGKPIHRKERVEDTAYSIVAQYQAEYAGVVQYYRLAYNLHTLGRMRWAAGVSLVKTLAAKLRVSCARVYRRFRTTLVTTDGTFRVLQVTLDRGPKKKPLEAHFGAVSLRWNLWAAVDESPVVVWSGRSELLERLLVERCELCGAEGGEIEVHHIRKLADLTGRTRWEKVMAARRRKTLVLCQDCHNAIHRGRYDGPALSYWALRKGLKFHDGSPAPAKKDRTMSGFWRNRPMARWSCMCSSSRSRQVTFGNSTCLRCCQAHSTGLRSGAYAGSASTRTPRPASLDRNSLTAARRWMGEPSQTTSSRGPA